MKIEEQMDCNNQSGDQAKAQVIKSFIEEKTERKKIYIYIKKLIIIIIIIINYGMGSTQNPLGMSIRKWRHFCGAEFSYVFNKIKKEEKKLNKIKIK